MRIKVILNADPGDFIDINYQYSLAAWIYRVMDKSNSGIIPGYHFLKQTIGVINFLHFLICIFRSSG